MKIRGSGRSGRRKFIRRLYDSYKKRRIAKTWIKGGRERVRVSTIFLTTDREAVKIGQLSSPFGVLPEGPPPMETMVFGGELDGETLSGYPSRAAARKGHRIMVAGVRLLIDRERRRRDRLGRMHAAYRRRSR